MMGNNEADLAPQPTGSFLVHTDVYLFHIGWPIFTFLTKHCFVGCVVSLTQSLVLTELLKHALVYLT